MAAALMREIHKFERTSMTTNNFEAIARLEFSSDGKGHNGGIINCIKVAATCPRYEKEESTQYTQVVGQLFHKRNPIRQNSASAS